jgi:outer membrane murein-binding lipoprotein Lpp
MNKIKLAATIIAFITLTGCNQDLKDRISKLESEKSSLEAELQTLHSKNNELQQQIITLLAEQLPTHNSNYNQQTSHAGSPIPATINFRKALMGHGLVAILNTNIKEPLTLMLEWENRATGARKERVINLDGQHNVELGHAEGFPIEPGDLIYLSNKSFNTSKITVPNI